MEKMGSRILNLEKKEDILENKMERHNQYLEQIVTKIKELQ